MTDPAETPAEADASVDAQAEDISGVSDWIEEGGHLEPQDVAGYGRFLEYSAGVYEEGYVKLGHVAFHCVDVKAVTQFYCAVLGFRVSDWMGDFFSFLRCGPDHHTITLMGTGSNRHFHTAFELRDWSHMQTACDFLSLNGYKLLWGPGRHGIGHNLFCYHRGPNGLITELFAELDHMNEELGYFEPRPWHRDRPQRPKVWAKDPNASNYWGIMPTDEMHH